VRIERFDPMADEDKLRVCHELVVSGQLADDPNVPAVSFGMFRSWCAYGFAGDPRQVWLATTDGGVPLGCYWLELPERDNKANGFLYPLVGLASRRQGIGTALVAHAAAQAGQAGRSLLMSNSQVGAPGADFAAAVGARTGLRDARRTVEVGPALQARLTDLRAAAEPHAAGYATVRWTGTTPDELVGQVCALYSALADAPHDEAFEPSTWDADRLRKADQRVVIQGSRSYSVARVHEASGQLAALTQIIVDPEIDGWAFQELTAVTRQHRGHRLGLLVKVAMLDWLAECEPQIRTIITYNAVQNEHIIAVNADLGFQVNDHFDAFELDVAAAMKLEAEACAH